MAHPIAFKPEPVDYRKELMRQVDAAPREHAEALLVLWQLLETSHKKGILELADGLISGKDIITGKLAEAANLPESLAAIRNGMALARLLGSLDPDMLQRLAKAMDEAAKKKIAREEYEALHGSQEKAKPKNKPPSFWHIFRKATSADARRGLGFGTDLLIALGRATRE